MILWTATSIITARSVIKGGLSHNHRCFLSLWPELWCTCHQVPHLLWTLWSSSSLSLGPVPSCEQQAPTKPFVGLRYRSVRQTDAKSAHFLQKVMYFRYIYSVCSRFHRFILLGVQLMVEILLKFQDFKSLVFDHALIVSRVTALMVRSAKIQIQNTFESGGVPAPSLLANPESFQLITGSGSRSNAEYNPPSPPAQSLAWQTSRKWIQKTKFVWSHGDVGINAVFDIPSIYSIGQTLPSFSNFIIFIALLVIRMISWWTSSSRLTEGVKSKPFACQLIPVWPLVII